MRNGNSAEKVHLLQCVFNTMCVLHALQKVQHYVCVARTAKGTAKHALQKVHLCSVCSTLFLFLFNTISISVEKGYLAWAQLISRTFASPGAA